MTIERIKITNKKKRALTIFGLLCIMLLFFLTATACQDKTELSEAERVAAAEFTDDAQNLENVTDSVLTDKVVEENPSLEKVYRTQEGDYLFFCAPVGYNGPIHFVLAIDDKIKKTKGLRVISHMETEEYVRDMESPWFVDRFANKNVSVYLERVKLEAQKENEIVAITGSTVTTDAMVQGVNDAFCAYLTMKKDESPTGATEGNKAQQSEQSGLIRFTDEAGQELGAVTVEQLKTLEAYRRKLVIHSSSGDSTHDFRGARLAEAIALVDPQLLTSYETISAVGADGYRADVPMAEVTAENNVYIMYEDFDRPIATEDGSPSGMRLIILKDDYGQRFTNYLYELQFKNE